MTSSPPPPADGPAEMPAGDILYPRPTIAGALPPLDGDGDRSGASVLFEDDWRRIEPEGAPCPR